MYEHRHRVRNHLHTHVGRAEATRIPAPLIDRWYGRNETYAGLYVVPAPAIAKNVDEVLNKTIGAVRELLRRRACCTRRALAVHGERIHGGRAR